jgi:hypothetical protein
MKNPQWVPELIFPTPDASSLSAHDWTIPELNDRPVYVTTTEQLSSDVETPTMRAGHTTHRHHVTPARGKPFYHVVICNLKEQFRENQCTC